MIIPKVISTGIRTLANNMLVVLWSPELLYIWMLIMLFCQVLSKIAGAFAREVALTTVEWLFSSVLAYVHSQTTTCSA